MNQALVIGLKHFAIQISEGLQFVWMLAVRRVKRCYLTDKPANKRMKIASLRITYRVSILIFLFNLSWNYETMSVVI
jgi:hypothetical protein